MKSIKEIEAGLRKSKFRSSFRLTKDDVYYIGKVGLNRIESHAEDFIIKRLAPTNPKNDGKQTPYGKHPVFKAQHATATCCRSCLYKWYNITKKRPLERKEIAFIRERIINWIKNELKNGKC